MSGVSDSFIYLSANLPVPGQFELLHFGGTEEISSCFEFFLTLSSDNPTIDFDAVMGKSVTVTIDVQGAKRYFNGIVGRFEQLSSPPADYNNHPPAVYMARLYPQAWVMKFSSNCQIFQNKSALDIIQQILQNNTIKMSNTVESHGQGVREFCVQYNESDFDFISRLMEEEGIFYYFTHEDGNHTMVLGDSPSSHQTCPNGATGQIMRASSGGPFLMSVSDVQVVQNTVPTDSSWVNFNFTTPQNILKADSKGPTNGLGGKVYQYPGPFLDQSSGDNWAKTRMEGLESFQHIIKAESSIPFFEAGTSFTLKGHTRSEINTEYVLYKVEHDARASKSVPVPHGFGDREPAFWGGANKDQTLYVNRFTGFPKTSPFRPPQITPRPVIYGTQTAIVTGKQDEEIYTEEYGRIKVKFHWDINGQNNENSSCWIRVATPWAGQGWGVSITPRIGQEVVISFLDGNPDTPIIVGSVYNGEHKPPYLPDTPAKSTIKSNSTKNGQNAHNEFTLDDTQGSEQVYLHAQKDLVVEIGNDERRTLIGGSRTTKLTASEEPSEEGSPLRGNDSLTLDKGDHSITIIEGNHSFTITKGDYSITLNDGNLTVSLLKGNMNFSTASGSISFECTGDFNVSASGAITMEAGGDISELAGGAMEMTAVGAMAIDVGAGLAIDVGAGMATNVGAGMATNVGAAIVTNVGGALNTNVGGAMAIDVGMACALTAGGVATVTGAGDVSVTGGGAVTVTAGGVATVTGGGDVSVTGGGAVTVTAGGAVLVTGGADLTLAAGLASQLLGGVSVEIGAPLITMTGVPIIL